MKNIFSRFRLNYNSLPIWLAIYFAVALNVTLASRLYHILSNIEHLSIGFAVSIPFFFIAAFTILFQIFNWPIFSRMFFAVLTLSASAVSYAMYNYGVVFDYGMIQNTFQSNVDEASTYVSTYSILWVTILGVIPALLIAFVPYQKVKPIGFLVRKVVSIVVAALVIAFIAFFYYQNYASVGRNNSTLKRDIVPTYFVHSTYKYIKQTYFSEPIEYKELGLDAKQSPAALNADKPTLVVFMLGETARANNYSRNGYPRPTNQYTDKDDVLFFKHVTSCGTATAVSVPCMFSNMPRHQYDEIIAKNQDGLIDILKRAGIDMHWTENDGGDKGVAKSIPLLELKHDSSHPKCNGSSCYDMAMLDHFDEQVKNLKGNGVLFFHLIGSHGPTYFQRYPVSHRFFAPDCPRSDIENCTHEQLVNTYDNTILYTDFVIHTAIQKLKALQSKYNTALVYISDHGESLGENGLYLHGAPYGIAPYNQRHVPLMMWMSDGFKQAKKMDINCLHAASENNQYSQDNVFHSMLGLMDVETNQYQKQLDIFEQCRAK